MILGTCIGLGVANLLMGIIYALYKNKENWKGYVVRMLTAVFLVVYAIVLMNLTSSFNALSLFITMGIFFVLLNNDWPASKHYNEKNDIYIGNLIKIAMVACFVVSAISLSSFNILPILGGLFVGIGLGLLVWAIKKYDVASAIMKTILYAVIGLFIGTTVWGVIASTHLIASILMLVSGVVFIISNLISTFAKPNRAVQIVCDILETIAYIMIVATIYLY